MDLREACWNLGRHWATGGKGRQHNSGGKGLRKENMGGLGEKLSLAASAEDGFYPAVRRITGKEASCMEAHLLYTHTACCRAFWWLTRVTALC